MEKYIRIMRLDHWIKQFFIAPGVVAGLVLLKNAYSVSMELLTSIVLAFLSTCFVASANYTINEWLDAGSDKYHPVKKHRSVVENHLDPRVVYTQYAALALIGLLLAYAVNRWLFAMEAWLFVMGILYNVKPIRTKDIPYIDVLTESVNNAIRLGIGWFAVSDAYVPPVSIVIGYWMAGAFLMATKRYAEYRMINNPELAGKYRKSFRRYTTHSLMLSAFFYAMLSVFFIGIFLVKYRLELLAFMPAMIGLFCYYFDLSFRPDSPAQKPEKLFREKGLMCYVLLLMIWFVALMIVDISVLENLANSELIKIR